MKRLFLVMVIVFAIGIGFTIYIQAYESLQMLVSEPSQLLELELRPASPVTWPSSSAVFFALMELEDAVIASQVTAHR